MLAVPVVFQNLVNLLYQFHISKNFKVECKPNTFLKDEVKSILEEKDYNAESRSWETPYDKRVQDFNGLLHFVDAVCTYVDL